MAITQISKRTFWNNLRFERNIRYKDLIQLFPNLTSIGCISGWFTGQKMPDTDSIKTLCDFFDVPFEKGKAEFEKASREWRSDGHTGKRDTCGTAEARIHSKHTKKSEAVEPETPFDDDFPFTVEPTVEVPKEETKPSIAPQEIFSAIYGKVSYEVFFEFTAKVAKRDRDAIKDIYGQVSYEDYEAIREVILDWCKGA